MLHKSIPLADRHAAHNYEYANAAARTGATGFVAGDLGKLAWQTDTNTFWILTATTPTWGAFGGFSGGSLSSAINTSRATVASHATTGDIWGAAGNQIDWTGTATTTAFPNAPQAGAERVLICAGACSFTAGANMLIDGVGSGGTVTCAANDQVIVRAVSTTQFKLSRIKYDGTAQVSASSVSPGGSLYLAQFSSL